jgi:hypothetical protein
MAYASLVSPMVDWVRTPKGAARTMLMLLATRHIAILLFEGFSLLGADIVAEAFNAANEFAAIANLNWTYEIFFLSAAGGNVTCS